MRYKDEYNNVLKLVKEKHKVRDSFTYNSNNIEGNTISLAETISIITNEYVGKAHNLREIFEVVNHSEAIDYIIENSKQALDGIYTKKVHEILMDKLAYDRGKYKENDNYVLGANFNTAPASQIEQVMHQFFENLNYQLRNQNEDIFDIIARSHIEFERIHPFSDGNGRTGRLIINKILLERGYPPVVIEGSQKKFDYYQMLENQDVNKLSSYFKELSNREEKRILSFEKAKQYEIEWDSEEYEM